MTSVMTPPPNTRMEVSPPPAPLADASMLEDKVPAGLKASRNVALSTLLIGLLFVMFSFRPLWHTDLWGHLAYGRAIVAAQALPVVEPLMPLCVGVPFVDSAWLTQVIGFLAIDRLGITAIGFLYASAIAGMATLLLFRLHQRSQHLGLATAGLLLWLWGSWQHLVIVRPQIPGMLCFTLLLTIVTSRHWRAWNWLAIPVLFAAWANLHGSFSLGLALLAGLAAGRAIDVLIRCGELRAVYRDSHVRRFTLLTELSAAVVLLNPYGVRLYAEVWNVAFNANVADLAEWGPLQLRLSQGQATAAVALLLIVLYRLSPRRITAAEVLLLFGFGAAALWSSRMLVWWMPLAAYYGVLHGSAIWHARRSAATASVRPVRNGRWSVISVGLVWLAFAITPFGNRVMHGDQGKMKLEKLVSRQTPLGVVEHLKKLQDQNRLPRGQAFNTYEWGDYLLWAGPTPLRVFVASHAHLLPREVWSDYVAISAGASDWDDKLDRYGVNLIVLDRVSHDGLIKRLRENESWRQSYSDSVGSVFVRRKAI